MPGRKLYDDGVLVKRAVVYRTAVAAPDASEAAVTDIIDLSTSDWGYLSLNLYVAGGAGDIVTLYVRVGSTYYAARKMTLDYDNEAFTVENVPATTAKVVVEAVGGTVTISYDYMR